LPTANLKTVSGNQKTVSDGLRVASFQQTTTSRFGALAFKKGNKLLNEKKLELKYKKGK
jgi:hypothetical protein